jgi:hypothetical protein
VTEAGAIAVVNVNERLTEEQAIHISFHAIEPIEQRGMKRLSKVNRHTGLLDSRNLPNERQSSPTESVNTN